MRKRVFWISMVLVIIFSANSSLASGCKVLGDELIDRIQSYEWNDMEEMVCDFPYATIPYRGSDTINTLNNLVICCGTERGVGIRRFVQTNNLFPIIWTTEFSIGMNYVDLTKVLRDWSDASDEVVVDYVANEDVQIVLCYYDSVSIDKDAFTLKFYVFRDQVYQIEFEFFAN